MSFGRNKAWKACGLGLVLASAGLALAACETSTVSSSGSVETSSEDGQVLDPSDFPNYVEDIDSLEYDYEVNDPKVSDPFFYGNVIYNETVMLRTQEDGTGLGYLRFAPTKIISIRDFTLTTEYTEGSDYVIDGNAISAPTGSRIGHWTNRQMWGEEDLPDPYVIKDNLSNRDTDCMRMGATIYTESPFYYGTQVYVTYAYDINDLDLESLPSSQIEKMPSLKAKLEAKAGTLKIAGIGDSVMEGCSSSVNFDHEPYQKPFFDLFGEAIAHKYGLEVTAENMGVGGTTSADGTQKSLLDKVVKYAPDLLLIHYGINDLGGGATPNGYMDNILYIVTYLKENLPDLEIILMSPLTPNPRVYDQIRLESYVNKLEDVADSFTGVVLLDAYAYGNYLLENGRDYYDMTGNGINHPNDYGHRVYTGALLATIETA